MLLQGGNVASGAAISQESAYALNPSLATCSLATCVVLAPAPAPSSESGTEDHSPHIHTGPALAVLEEVQAEATGPFLSPDLEEKELAAFARSRAGRLLHGPR